MASPTQRNFEPAPRALFFKSPRVNDSRIGESVLATNEDSLAATTPGHVLLGYPDDEGIRSNFGRPGAAEAPDAIRTALYKLTPGRKDFPLLYDIGNLILSGSLKERQARARKTTTEIFKLGHRLISLGGGNDYAYPDVAGFLSAQKKRPLVINIDAHLDVRPDHNGPNSGTPFYQLLENFDNFDLVEIGIQPFGNSQHFMDYATKKKVKIFTFADSHQKLAKVFQRLAVQKRPVYLSIDIDAFSSAYAPGSSAASPIGLDPAEFISCMPFLAQKMDIRALSIYEVSPPLDIHNQTAKLAAIILQSYLCNLKR